MAELLTGQFLGSATKLATTIFYILIVILILGMLFFIYYRIRNSKRFNIQVRIYSKRKEGFKSWTDLGAFIKNKRTGEVYGFQLKKEKIMIQPPNYDYLVIAPKGNILHLYQKSNDEFFPLIPDLDIDNKIMTLRVIEGDIQLWATTMIDRLYTMYSKPGFFEKYGAYLIFTLMAMFIIIMIYLVLQKFDVLKDVASSLQQTATIIRDSRGAGLPSGSPPA